MMPRTWWSPAGKADYLLLAIILLAFALRVYRLDSQSLWYDEAVTAKVASQGIGELTRWTADDIQPPLYYYAAAGWLRLAGRGEWALRFPSAFFGTLTVPLMWAVGSATVRPGPQRAGGRPRRGAVDCALAAVRLLRPGSAHVHAVDLPGAAGRVRAAQGDGGRGIRDEGTIIVFRLSSFVRKWWFLFVIASAALLYTHYFGVFLLLAYGMCFAIGWLVALAWGRPHWRMLAAFALAA